VLSLFPGIGLLDLAFEEQGFCVVRGPDLLWGGDIQRFTPPTGKFDGVIGGPPCQAFSRLRHMVEQNGYAVAPDLIPEFNRVVAAAAPAWFLMENVNGAYEPIVPGYIVRSEMVADHWCGGETSRLRRFSFGTRDARALRIETLALHRPDPVQAALASGGSRAVPVAIGGSGKRKPQGLMRGRGYKTNRDFRQHVRLQGLPEDFDLPGFTQTAKIKAIGNGVPMAMGRAVARAVKVAVSAVM